MNLKGNPIKNIFVLFIFQLILVVPACELFLPFPEDEELVLETIILVKPQNGSNITLNNYDIQFSWTDIGENENYNTYYEFYLGESPNPGLYASDLSYNYYNLDLEKNKTYYWKIVSKVDDKYSESEVWSFTTD